MATPIFSGFSIAVASISLMIGSFGMLLGLGYALNNKRIRDFGFEELVQTFIGAAIIASLYFAFSSSGFISTAIDQVFYSANASATCYGISAPNPAVCFAYAYTAGLSPIYVNGKPYPSLMDSALTLITPVSILYGILAVLGSIKLSGIFISIGFASFVQPLLSQINYIISALTFAMISLEVQGIIIRFASTVAIPVLLPIGLILRTVYFTKRLGGMLVALAIGFYAVFPLTYLLGAELISSYSINPIQLSDSVSSYSGSILTGMQNSVQPVIGSANFSILDGLYSAVKSAIAPIESLVESLISAVAVLITEVFFIPLLSLMITITSTRELARLLGSEISFGKFDIF
ncbi:MAG: hypothetical protein QXN59_00380 [Candidatus Micrarchaeaceae archaeon]